MSRIRDERRKAAGARSARSVIEIRNGELPTIVAETERALLADETPIYQRGGQLVRPATVETPGGRLDRSLVSTIIVPVIESWLRLEIGRVARLKKWSERQQDFVNTDCPELVARALLSRVGQFPFPPLVSLIYTPTVRPDGSLLDRPGYDSATGLLAIFTNGFPEIDRSPSLADARRALARIAALFGTFPFVSDADRAVPIAGVITAVLRPALPTAPLIAFSSTTRGSGKSMIVDIISYIATGLPAAVIAIGVNGDEAEKRLAAALLQGYLIISLDNVEMPLGGVLLCQVLTQDAVSVRPLGQSRQEVIPSRAFFMATGNNLIIKGDMTRRALVAMMDPGVERPELREFDVDPRETARQKRGEIVRDAVTIVLAHIAAGSPRMAPPLGSYGEWSSRVRDAMMWAGAADPVAVMERTYAADPERERLAALMASWLDERGAQPVTARDLIRSAETDGSALAEPLEAVASARGGRLSAKSLGHYLKRHAGRIVDGLRIQSVGDDGHGTIRWAVSKPGADPGFRVDPGLPHYLRGEIQNGANYGKGSETNPAEPGNPEAYCRRCAGEGCRHCEEVQ